MINVLVPITKNDKRYKDILHKLAEREDLNLIVGVKNELRGEFGFVENLHIYDDSFDKESILNALFTKVEEGATIVMRKPITVQEFDRISSCDEHIATCKKERNAIKSFFYKLWQKILKLLLGVNLYAGDTSVVYFSEVLLPILIENGNLSFASRVDRWIGVDKTTVDVKVEPEKYSADSKAILRYCLIADACLLVACLVTTFVCVFAEIGIILGLLLFCIDAICFAILLICIVLIIFNCSVGKKNVETAVEIGNIYDNERED